ncbi:hypothetical protein [Staphylococcus auricularis]|uniref:hypothetical protein n=1 Tax=Staphylococcus auricularis TaxID=29379 RepID=UPI002433086B|nr:hypothetical protein [Staphylococcus auricularis]
MEFKVVKTSDDPLFKEALSLYDGKLDIALLEDEQTFVQSLENKHTKDDYVFLVGIEDNTVVSLATAHYEATTHSAFLIYLIASDREDHDDIISLTLEQIELKINELAQYTHDRDVNFIMFEVPQAPLSTTPEEEEVLKQRRLFLRQYGFEKQTDIDYRLPPLHGERNNMPMDLYIKSNIELTKDIYGTSVKSNYILKYVFANRIPRSVIYPILEEMGLHKSTT